MLAWVLNLGFGASGIAPPSGPTPAGRHRKRYGVRDGEKLLLFDTKAEADQARAAIEARRLPPARNQRRKVKVAPIPPAHEVISLPEAARTAAAVHEEGAYHELLAAHAYSQLAERLREWREADEARKAHESRMREEEEIAVILMHL